MIFFTVTNAAIAAATYPIYFSALDVYLSSNFGIVFTVAFIVVIRPFAASNLSFKNIAVPGAIKTPPGVPNAFIDPNPNNIVFPTDITALNVPTNAAILAQMPNIF